MTVLHLKFILHPLLPDLVHAHCPVSTLHIHDTVVHRRAILLRPLDFLQAWVHEPPRHHHPLFKADQFDNFSSQSFPMNSLFRVQENTSLFCSRLMTAGVSLRGITLGILVLLCPYSTPCNLEEKVTENLPELVLSRLGSLSSPRRECAWKGLFAAPVLVCTKLVTALKLRFPGPTLELDDSTYRSFCPPLPCKLSEKHIYQESCSAGLRRFPGAVVL